MKKGTGANLLKVGSKRRRTRQEILDFKTEAKAKEESMNAKIAEIEQLLKRNLELE